MEIYIYFYLPACHVTINGHQSDCGYVYVVKLLKYKYKISEGTSNEYEKVSADKNVWG